MSLIFQWNCQGLISKWAEMKQLFLFLAPIIIAVQETWFLPTDSYNFSVNNYSLFRFDEVNGYRRHGGTALYINKDFPHTEIHLNTHLQAVACTVRLYGRNIDFCSIYIPPDFDNTCLLQSLNHLISQFHHPFVLLGDFNAHSPLWDRKRSLTDQRGHIVEDFIDSNNIVLLNKGDSTHYSFTHNSESAIDLSLCSANIGTLFDWTADSDVYGSDHFPIKLFTTFNSLNDSVPNYIPRWNLKKANWALFEELSTIDQEEFTSPEQGIHFIMNKILTAAAASIPKTSPPQRRKSVPWWCPEASRAVARRKRAFRSYIRHKDIHHLIVRNHERSKTKRIIRESKRKSWQFFVSQLTMETPMSRIWGLVRSLCGKKNTSCLPALRIQNTLITDPKVIVNT